MQLVRARLGKRLREGNFRSYREYYNYVVNDTSGEELCGLLDAISTNTTHLFRESQHFDLLRNIVARWASDRAKRATNRTLRIWSAGCSSGEEPYSLVMVAHDVLRNHPTLELKILATDLSIRMLSRAKLGIFEPHRVGTVPPALKNRYLLEMQQDGQAVLQVTPELRRLVTFARFNLMSPSFPFRHRFDVIFCRNVMIYFDRPTQQSLVNKFVSHLQDGGYFMIGHSESLSGTEHPLSYVEPTVYRKV
jgi:chemotaxis protein methyltransferase CheR